MAELELPGASAKADDGAAAQNDRASRLRALLEAAMAANDTTALDAAIMESGAEMGDPGVAQVRGLAESVKAQVITAGQARQSLEVSLAAQTAEAKPAAEAAAAPPVVAGSVAGPDAAGAVAASPGGVAAASAEKAPDGAPVVSAMAVSQAADAPAAAPEEPKVVLNKPPVDVNAILSRNGFKPQKVEGGMVLGGSKP